MTQHLLRLVVAASMIPALASAKVVWKGDYETGNTSQWSREQSVSSNRLLVVSDVVREGRYSLKATVRHGDDPINASGNRNELLYLSDEKTNSTWFYKWSTLFPANYPVANDWQVFTQWHQEGCCGSPPLEFFAKGEKLYMRVGGSSGKVLWTGDMARGQWHDFVLQVKWSSNAKTGFVQLWHNGKEVVPKTMAATQFGSDPNYLKQGLYRSDAIKTEAFIYHDGFTMAESLDDVMPPPAPEPVPTPTPTPTPETEEQPSPVPDTTTPDTTTPDTTTPDTETPSTPSPSPSLPGTGGSTPGSGVIPGSDTGTSGSAGMPGAPASGGCSASGSGSAPVVLALGVLGAAAALGRRRRMAAVPVKASRRR